jgi:hypothetical protein
LRKIAALLDRFDMISTRAMASLAVNALRDAPRKTRFAAGPVGPSCDFCQRRLKFPQFAD